MKYNKRISVLLYVLLVISLGITVHYISVLKKPFSDTRRSNSKIHDANQRSRVTDIPIIYKSGMKKNWKPALYLYVLLVTPLCIICLYISLLNNPFTVMRGSKRKIHDVNQHPRVTYTPINHQSGCPEDVGSVWSFQCRVDCPRWENLSDSDTVNAHSYRRKQLVPVCDSTSVAVRETSRDDSKIPAFAYNDTCLQRLVREFCYDRLVVPKLVHYIWFGKREMGFYHFLSFWSAHKTLKPCFIFVHSNYLPFGRYWDFLLKNVANLIHVNRSQPLDIYGTKIKFIEHSADFARMEAVRDFGGIYIDTDTVILRPFEALRRYKFTMSRAFDFNLSNGLLVSARNATFLSYWFDAYKEYDPNAWGKHSTIVPWQLSKLHGEHIHIEQFTFVKPNAIEAKEWIFRRNFNWENNYAIHMFIRYNRTLHDFVDMRTLNTTVGSVARFTLFGNKEVCNV